MARDLPGRFRALAEGGADWHGRYSSQFAARRALVLAAINAGWSFDDCYRAWLADDASPAYDLFGSSGKHLSRGQRAKRLSDDYAAERAYAERSPLVLAPAECRQRIGNCARWRPAGRGRESRGAQTATFWR